MKRALFIIAVAGLAACDNEPKAEATDTRMPIEVQYVRESALKIHTKALDDAPVVTTYQHGESVSVLSRRGAWAEVRTATGSGWVRANELVDAAEATKAEGDNVKPHFTREPQPVTQPGVHGDVVLEADVNTDGLVTNVRTIRNTTGSMSLETRNAESLRHALFTPLVRRGRREAFVYEHRVHY
ncbi:MAG TPA: SH3 domain-containing protein [Thermoanaerobaculia bacterium]|jgi:uncharacterized protein YgiM (DUF1202 family)|nr:SH3 domain-containing protein [Thermoanaerobaculia bacterium]